MKHHPIRTLVALAAAACVGQVAFAQASAPLSRAEVKAETRAAEKARQLTPAGPGSPTAGTPRGPSTTTRAERKAETLAARKAGTLKPAGPGGTLAERMAPPPKSTKTRAERKAETRQAVRNKEMVPAGEGPGAPKK